MNPILIVSIVLLVTSSWAGDTLQPVAKAEKKLSSQEVKSVPVEGTQAKVDKGTANAGKIIKDPVELIRQKDIELQALLKINKKKSEPKTIEKIKFLINDIFDFEALAQKSLNSETWDTLGDLEKSDFVSNFKKMVENSSVKKLEIYESDSTTYEESKVRNGKAKVTAHVWSGGKESILVYKVDQNDLGAWKAWDLVIDDLSTVRNYREQFSKILETKPFSELISIIKEKADSYDAS